MVKLLNEREVAERLACSVSKVKKLRLSGRLPYIPGRPPLIVQADFEAVLQAELQKVASRKKRARERRKALETANPPPPVDIEEEVRRLARRVSIWRRTSPADIFLASKRPRKPKS